VLSLDGIAIAAAIHLVAGPEAVAFKCAYDETWSRASPGVLLDLHTARLTLDGGLFRLMDSGAIPGHPVETLWRDRVSLGQLAMALSERTPLSHLDALARRQRTARMWRARAGSVLERVRRIKSARGAMS
jgi:hypothetical protein